MLRQTFLRSLKHSFKCFILLRSLSFASFLLLVLSCSWCSICCGITFKWYLLCHMTHICSWWSHDKLIAGGQNVYTIHKEGESERYYNTKKTYVTYGVKEKEVWKEEGGGSLRSLIRCFGFTTYGNQTAIHRVHQHMAIEFCPVRN